jgi:hypothetical protein
MIVAVLPENLQRFVRSFGAQIEVSVFHPRVDIPLCPSEKHRIRQIGGLPVRLRAYLAQDVAPAPPMSFKDTVDADEPID